MAGRSPPADNERLALAPQCGVAVRPPSLSARPGRPAPRPATPACRQRALRCDHGPAARRGGAAHLPPVERAAPADDGGGGCACGGGDFPSRACLPGRELPLSHRQWGGARLPKMGVRAAGGGGCCCCCCRLLWMAAFAPACQPQSLLSSVARVLQRLPSACQPACPWHARACCEQAAGMRAC